MEYVQPIRDKKQIDSIKKILRATNLRDHALFVLGINSGLRVSDLLKLKIRDVMDGSKIQDRILLREQKTGKTKDFPLSDNARKALIEYIKTREGYSPDDALFASRKGGRSITRHQAYRIINDAARSVGIKENIGTHTLRKTFGYHAYQAGVDITRIQKLLNHSAPSVTLAYIGITQEELDDVYLNLNL
ncbi:site-specific integrase (plasmid) [Alicyclobacillus fastidiosus]|uniref:Site-specific integrase n=1 Tax=Alicyclobacillus fastidiosus TaxID=392011 RepID=A0ABY6ZPM2_9BACL|nr:site-specific integrase [Alicyclobacillus fastidiosus]WAH44791.1 site-specific integrase [Alicyclobacillus fastidiosus]GMA65746.1 site-specific integrase [Alicyclobacillus fastidiosus]GMA65920.1 site-specific integrase [Alicyclobacillus fastidiosus]